MDLRANDIAIRTSHVIKRVTQRDVNPHKAGYSVDRPIVPRSKILSQTLFQVQRPDIMSIQPWL